jgi:hypothetical protein
MVNQRLDLRRPVAKILRLIQEDVGAFAGAGGLIEGPLLNGVLEPARDCQDRVLDPRQRRDLAGREGYGSAQRARSR